MSKKIKQTVAMLAVVGGAVVGIATLTNALWYAPEDSGFLTPSSSLSLQIATSTPLANTPVRLRIPMLAIDARVQSVGVGKSGNMAVPTNYTDVAWYRNGASPGSMGSAVFDGHVDNGFGLSGVFKHLGDIAPGEKILSISQKGVTYTYKVDRVENYPLDSVPNKEIFTEQYKSQLVIITCEGTWISGENTYDHRLVVYATLES